MIVVFLPPRTLFLVTRTHIWKTSVPCILGEQYGIYGSEYIQPLQRILAHIPCRSFCFSLIASYGKSQSSLRHTLVKGSTANSLFGKIGGNEYTTAPPSGQPQSQHSSSQPDLSSPSNARYAQQFYPTYPSQPSTGGAQMPAVPDAMDTNMTSHASTLAAPIAASVKDEDDEKKRHLFGDVPEAKRRKFILVDDTQRGTRVRVRVMLDQVNMDEMPDAHLRTNAVYPRSYYPRQMRSPPGSPRALGQWDDEDDVAEGSGESRGTTLVPVSLMDGTEAKLPVPRMNKSKRSKESALNELGYRMSWSQARQFNGRTLFLQRSRELNPHVITKQQFANIFTVDAYRNKMRSTMVAGGQDVASIAPHFETRTGKRKWLERTKRDRRGDDSP
jgi:hypothetical protein